MPYRDKSLSEEVRGKIKQLYRLLMSASDFQQANKIAQQILNRKLHDNMSENRILIEALNCAMIVAYARPFSGNDKNSEEKIPDLPKSILKGLSPEELEMHEIVIQDRNEVIAHSDSEARNYEPQVLIIDESNKVFMPWSNDTRAPLIQEATQTFVELSQKLHKKILEKRMELEPELLDYFEATSVEEMEKQNKE